MGVDNTEMELSAATSDGKCKKAVEMVEARMKASYDPVFNPTKPKPYYKSICFFLTLTVFITSATGVIILWGTDTWDITILKIITLEDNGYVYSFWRRPDFETTIKIYPFNYTNIDMIGKEPPHVEETGPYVFRERMERVNVVFNSDGTLTYSENHTHEFDEAASAGTLTDVINTPNVPFMSAAASGAQKNIISQLTLAAILKGLDTRLFLPVDIEGFVMGFDDSFSIIARQLSNILNGNKPPKFGLLTARIGLSEDRVTVGTGIPDLDVIGIVSNYDGLTSLNYWNTDEMYDGLLLTEKIVILCRIGLSEDRVTVGTGIPDLDGIGIVSNYDGLTSLNYWDTDECNSISGSDGTLFPGRLVQRSKRLYIYAKDFCRRIPIDFLGERIITRQDFPAKRFEWPHNIFDKPEDNPENSCFCSSGDCSPRGTFKTAICTFGAPTLISFPHFLHGDPALRTNVTGLHPDPQRHRFYLDVHETFGIPVGGNSRFQVNVMVSHCPFLSQLNAIPNNTILPIAWLDVEPGELEGSLNDLIYHATYTVAYINTALSWTSLLLLFASAGRIFCFVYYKR